MPTLEEFKSALYNTNIVRPNRFLVYIFGFGNEEENSFFATSASIPDRNFNEIILKYYGMDFKVPGGEVTQDLSINFIVDDQWKIREFFETWASLINDRTTSAKGYMQQLFADDIYIEVHQLGFNNEVIAKYKFKHIFPKTMDIIDLNMETLDSHSTFQVTFSYSYWERVV